MPALIWFFGNNGKPAGHILRLPGLIIEVLGGARGQEGVFGRAWFSDSTPDILRVGKHHGRNPAGLEGRGFAQRATAGTAKARREIPRMKSKLVQCYNAHR